MDKIVYNIKLDLLNEGIQGSLKGLRMGEHDARQIRISLRQNLKAANLDGTETAIMFVRKTGVESPSLQACTIEGNEIVYDINASDVDTEGEVLFTLKIQLNGAITFAPHFCGYVMNPDVSDAEVPSQVEYTALEALINEVDGIKDDWEDALEELQEIIEHGGGTNVIANPTLDGTEPTLNGIQIGDGKYKIPEGGSGGVSDYNDLLNIPSINGVVVSGNKGLSDYGMEPKTVICESEEDYDSMLHDPNTRYLVPLDESEVGEKVIANPVLAGTEESLTGLQIGEEKYKIPQGGGGGGFSPTVVVTDITGGHRVTITDELGPHTFDVMDGADGQNGADGQDGADGADGFSPTVSVTNITGGHKVTITDKNGAHEFDVMDGEDSTGSGSEFDINELADIYNTGCDESILDAITGNTTFYDTDHNKTFVLHEYADYDAFSFYGVNFSDCTKDVEYVIENKDFSQVNFPAIRFQKDIYPDQTQYNIILRFVNCKFYTLRYTNQTTLYSNLKFVFERCTAENLTVDAVGMTTLQRCKIRGVNKDALDVSGDMLIDTSYCEVVGDSVGTTEHTDAFQYWGHPSGHKAKLTIKNSRFINPKIYDNVYVNSCLMFQTDSSGIDEINIDNVEINGGGYSLYINPTGGKTIDHVNVSRLKVGCYAQYGTLFPSSAWDTDDAETWDCENASALSVGSIYSDSGRVKVCVRNDTNQNRKLTVVLSNGVKTVFDIPKCITYAEKTAATVLADFPWNLIKDAGASQGVSFVECYDSTSGTDVLISRRLFADVTEIPEDEGIIKNESTLSGDSTVTLNNNEFYKFGGSPSSIVVSLTAPALGRLGIYALEFTVADATTFSLELPDEVAWGNIPEFEDGGTYQVTIMNDIALYCGA